MTEQELERIADYFKRKQNFFNTEYLGKPYSELGQPTIPSYKSAFPTIGVDLENIDASKEMENTQAQQRVKYVDTDTAAQVVRYVDEDTKQAVKMCKEMLNMRFGKYFEIQKVIFNAPATIVFWKDGTKTVVKAQKGDKFDPEKGLAMAFAKRALGDKGNYYNVFQKHLPKSKVLKSTAGRKKAGKNTAETQKTDKKSANRLIVDKDGNMKLVNKPEVSQKTKKEG